MIAEIENIKVGVTDVDKIYQGDFLLWQQYGSAFYGGEDVYISPTNRITSNNPTRFTMMAWVKTTNLTKDQIYLSNRSGIYLRIVSSRPFYSLTLPSQTTYGGGSNYLEANRWYHMAVTYDVSDNLMRCYLDGVEIYSRLPVLRSDNSYYVNTSSTVLQLGRFVDSSPRTLEGNLMNVQLWDKALTTDEINQYKYMIFSHDIPELICQYPLIKDGNDVKGNNGINYGVTWSKDAPYKNIQVP